MRTRSAIPSTESKPRCCTDFTQYTVWPTSSFSSNTAPIVVGILGDNPFGPWLSEIDGKSVDEKGKPSRTLALAYKRPGDDLSDCHLLFVSRSEKDRAPSLIAGLKGKPILTVSEIDKFTQSGGMVRFVLVGGNVKFEINPQAIEDSGLKISALVGRLAITAKSDAETVELCVCSRTNRFNGKSPW